MNESDPVSARLRVLAPLSATVILAACGVQPPIITKVTLDFPKEQDRLHLNTVTELSSEGADGPIRD